MDIKTKDCTCGVATRHESRPSNFLLCYDHEHKGRVPLGPPCLIGPKQHGCLLRPCRFLRDRPFWPIFSSHFWLKVNNDTVFEAIVLEYDRYEPPLGARSCHKYLVLWQDLTISINYVKHVLFVILRHMGTFKNVFNLLIVQIPGLCRT